MLRLGIDLGGTKIEIAAFDEHGRELLRRRVATPQGDYRATVGTVAALVEAVENELHARGSVGIGMPGAESRNSGLIKNANSTCLIGQPLRRDLQTLLQREIRLANDANCFALSEAVDGAAAGAEVVFGVILGTGCGGGIIVRGQVLSLRQREYVEAASALDLGAAHIIFREMLPNMTSLLLAQVIGGTIYAIGAQVGLEFLGLGTCRR